MPQTITIIISFHKHYWDLTTYSIHFFLCSFPLASVFQLILFFILLKNHLECSLLIMNSINSFVWNVFFLGGSLCLVFLKTFFAIELRSVFISFQLLKDIILSCSSFHCFCWEVNCMSDCLSFAGYVFFSSGCVKDLFCCLLFSTMCLGVSCLLYLCFLVFLAHFEIGCLKFSILSISLVSLLKSHQKFCSASQPLTCLFWSNQVPEGHKQCPNLPHQIAFSPYLSL